MSLQKLFYPNFIAVIGASPGNREDRFNFFQSLIDSGFAGFVYPVNPRHEQIYGYKTYGNVKDIPEEIDLAIVTVPQELVSQVVKDCVEKEVKFVHIFSSGFAEVGNYQQEQELLKIIKGSKTRIIGPNCIGVCCPYIGINYMGLPKDKQTNPGNIAFFSQSGGQAISFVLRAFHLGILVDKVISFGNQLDITLDEYVDYFANDSRVQIICGYVEGVKDGRKFFSSLQKATSKKPVLIWKGGITEIGARTAQSHTGALATSSHIWESAMHQAGVISINSFEELFGIVDYFQMSNKPSGLRAGVLLGGGGTSVILSDSLTSNGIELPPLDQKTQENILKLIKSVNTFTINPVDLGMFTFYPQIITYCLEIMSNDPNIDFLIFFFSAESFKLYGLQQSWYDIIELIKEKSSRLSKPLFVVCPYAITYDIELFEMRADAESKLRSCGISVFPTAEQIAHVFKKGLVQDLGTRS